MYGSAPVIILPCANVGTHAYGCQPVLYVVNSGDELSTKEPNGSKPMAFLGFLY